MTQNQISGELLLIIYVLIFAAAYYFLLVLPQRRRAQQRRQLIESLKAGDEVITIGGIIGTITAMEADLVRLQVDKNVELRLSKDAIAGSLAQERPKESAS